MVSLFRPRKPSTAAHADHGHHANHGHSDAELKAAYERGRRDEKARRRRSPLLVLGLTAAALIGGASLVLAAKEGSFREGGALMDRGVSTAAREAVPTLKRGAAEAGEGLRDMQDRISSDNQQQPG